MTNDVILISLLIIVNILCGIVGYFIGVFTSNKGVYNSPQSFFKQQKDQKDQIGRAHV